MEKKDCGDFLLKIANGYPDEKKCAITSYGASITVSLTMAEVRDTSYRNHQFTNLRANLRYLRDIIP